MATALNSFPPPPTPPPHLVIAPRPPALAPARTTPKRQISVLLLTLSVLSAGATVAIISSVRSEAVGVIGFTAAVGIAIGGVLCGIAELAHARGAGTIIVSILAILGNAAMTAIGMFTALLSIGGYSRGRQLRRFGRVLLPPIRHGGSWAGCDLEVLVPEPIRAALAQQWRENGRTEHASVAAFARLTLDLMALGAPPKLVAAANRDAIDEIRHAELCFSLARSLDGRNDGPGPFPAPQRARSLQGVRVLALATLAVDSLIDGALHEGVSARIIARLARRCEDPAIRAVLEELAADEGRHAANGWHVVEWCLAEGGRPVAHAARAAVSVIPKRMKSDLPAPAMDGSWERWGILRLADSLRISS